MNYQTTLQRQFRKSDTKIEAEGVALFKLSLIEVELTQVLSEFVPEYNMYPKN